MDIFLNILFLFLGMAFLIKGADFFVKGASSLARKLKVPSIFIGLTIVALGTSLPELSVSLASAIKKGTELSVGNIVGSNMMNMLFIFGIIALIKPVYINKTSKKIDIPFLVGLTLLLLIFSCDSIINGEKSNIISRTECIVMLVVLIIYFTILLIKANKERKLIFKTENLYSTSQNEQKIMKNWQMALCIIFGLAAVVFGAECVSSTAQFLAKAIGMSQKLVGLTIVAVGTSLPELATSIAAAKRGENQMALGNIIGSNILNISLILGLVGLVSQIEVSPDILIDILILTLSTVIFAVITMTQAKVSKISGMIFIFMYITYIVYAIVINYCF